MFVLRRFAYVGAADGHIEVFSVGEFGNIRDRIETPLLMGVEQVVALRDNLLLAACSAAEEMRFVHVNPNRTLHALPCAHGVDIMVLVRRRTAGSATDSSSSSSPADVLLTTSADGGTLRLHRIGR